MFNRQNFNPQPNMFNNQLNANQMAPNPILNMFGNMQNFQQQLNSFAQSLQNGSQQMNPQQMVQNLLNSGQMSQEQFQAFSQIADQMTGRKF